jgi:hypothetical protein
VHRLNVHKQTLGSALYCIYLHGCISVKIWNFWICVALLTLNSSPAGIHFVGWQSLYSFVGAIALGLLAAALHIDRLEIGSIIIRVSAEFGGDRLHPIWMIVNCGSPAAALVNAGTGPRSANLSAHISRRAAHTFNPIHRSTSLATGNMSGYNHSNGQNAGGRPFDVSDFQHGQQDDYSRQQQQLRHDGGTPIDPSVSQQQRPPEGYGQYGMNPSPYAQYPPQQQQQQGAPPGASPPGGMAGHMMNPSPYGLAGYASMGDPYGVNRSLPSGGTPTGRPNFNVQQAPPPQPMMAGAYGYGTGRPEYHMPYVSYNSHPPTFQNRNDYGGGGGGDSSFSSPHDPYGMQHNNSSGMQQGGGVGGAVGGEAHQSMMMGKDNNSNNNDPSKTPRMFKKPMLQKVTR